MELPGIDEKLRDVVRQAVPVVDASGAVVTAIRLGGEPIGSLAILGGGLSDTCCNPLPISPPSAWSELAGRRSRPARKRHGKAANCVQRCWMQWPTSSRRP